MRTSPCPFWGRYAKAGFFSLLVLPLCGCPDAGRSSATVTGTVTYQGKPLPTGKVTFYGPNDQVASAFIEDDGHYDAKSVPVGAVKVAVSTPPPPGKEFEKAVKAGKRRFGTAGNVLEANVNTVAIPLKYLDPGKSGLQLTVTGGVQTYNIELK